MRNNDNISLNLLTISGEAKVRAENDIASISLKVVTKNKNSAAARKENNEKMKAIFSIIEKFGIDKRYFQTSGYSYGKWVEYEIVGKGQQKQQKAIEKGWQVSNGLDITLKDMDKLDDLYDALAASGCTSLGSPVFGVGNADTLTNEARKLAMKDALARAKLYADVAGVQVTALKTFSESTNNHDEDAYGGQTRIMAAAAPAAAAGGVPINPGSKQIIVRVNCTFEITAMK